MCLNQVNHVFKTSLLFINPTQAPWFSGESERLQNRKNARHQVFTLSICSFYWFGLFVSQPSLVFFMSYLVTSSFFFPILGGFFCFGVSSFAFLFGLCLRCGHLVESLSFTSSASVFSSLHPQLLRPFWWTEIGTCLFGSFAKTGLKTSESNTGMQETKRLSRKQQHWKKIHVCDVFWRWEMFGEARVVAGNATNIGVSWDLGWTMTSAKNHAKR